MPTFPLVSIGVGSQLYLTAAPGIEIGTRLNGGHFRDTVEQGVVTDHGSILEIAWELVRMREFPSRPCRFDALFLWPDEVRARGWHYRQGFFDSETSSQRGLYQVEVERICRIWAADMNLISYIRDGETVGELMQRARQYWESAPSRRTPEILLHGQVIVRNNLRELGIEHIAPIQDASVDALIRERLWSDLSGHSCLLLQSSDSLYLLSLQMTVATDLPTPLAGWIGLEIEGLNNEVLRPRRGMEPILVTGHAPLSYRLDDESGACETPYEFKDPVVADAARKCVLGKRRFRPVLICNREAAHYWQLRSYWDGQIPGDWTIGKT